MFEYLGGALGRMPKVTTKFLFIGKMVWHFGGHKRKANALNKAGTHTSRKRRRTSTVTKAKYQAPTARNQRKQIISNAKAVAYLNKIVRANRIWCDWQYFGDHFAKIDPAGNYTAGWGAFALTDFSLWNPVLRTDDNVSDSSTTFVKRMQINMRYSLNASNLAQFSVFIVTLRRTSADYDPLTAAPATPTDYIVNSQDYNVRLNPAVFKVHYARQLTLTNNAFNSPIVAAETAGNPNTTWAKGQVNLQPKMKVRAPTGPTPKWKTLTAPEVPYYQRYFLLIYINQSSASGLDPNTGARLQFDQLSTTINAD